MEVIFGILVGLIIGIVAGAFIQDHYWKSYAKSGKYVERSKYFYKVKRYDY